MRQEKRKVEREKQKKIYAQYREQLGDGKSGMQTVDKFHVTK